MKKITLYIVGMLLVISSALSAKVVYVSSFRTKVYKSKSRSSRRVLTVRRGTGLKLLSRSGSWYKVKYGNRVGWVMKMFTSARKPGRRMSILGTASTQARMNARRRASTDVTAASARGLSDESAAGRSRLSAKQSVDFNPAVLDNIERLYISEKELIKFLAEGGIK